jgi:hypothetical protein
LAGGVRGKDFFSFFPGSNVVSSFVPFKFPMGCHQVPNMFPQIQSFQL